MGRRKAEEVIEKETAAPDTEDTQILNLSDMESEEAELINDGEDAPVEAAAEEKPKRQRRARKPKAEVMAEPIETPEIEASEEKPEELEEEKEAKPRRASRARKTEPALEVAPEMQLASKNMDEMIKQWTAIKDISTTISQNFEKINGAFPKAPTDFVETGEFFKPQLPKVPFITKFATGASLVATLLSVLSLSLSQSARNAVLSQEVAARQAQSSIPVASAPVNSAPEIAMNNSLNSSNRHAAPARRARESKEQLFRVKK